MISGQQSSLVTGRVQWILLWRKASLIETFQIWKHYISTKHGISMKYYKTRNTIQEIKENKPHELGSTKSKSTTETK